MTVLTRLEQWKAEGAISGPQHDAIAALVRKDRFSLFVELNALLYLGVLALAAGLGWTMTSQDYYQRILATSWPARPGSARVIRPKLAELTT